MAGFEPIELTWGGKTYTIRSNQIMGAVQTYERAMAGKLTEDLSVTVDQVFMKIVVFGMSEIPAVCAHVYGRLLRYAGAPVSDDDVYLTCRDEKWTGPASMEVIDRIRDVHLLRLPPDDRARMDELLQKPLSELSDEETGAQPDAEAKPENPTNAAPASSKPHTRQRSAADG